VEKQLGILIIQQRGKNNRLAQIYQIMHSKIMIKFILIIKWNLLSKKVAFRF